MIFRRFELSTFGIDEANQGLTTDPFVPASTPTSLGLRIPPVISTTPQPRYLFLLAQRNLSRGKTVIRGIRQGLTIGTSLSNSSDVPLTAEEFLVTSPFWKFSDGNVSWHLVREPNDSRVLQRPNTDAASWAYMESTTPAMLYQTFSNSNINANGQPYYYDIGMTAYLPPSPNAWQPIAGLGNFKDMRFPWNLPTNSVAIDETVEGSCKISLYASVLQTNPTTRAQAILPSVSNVYPGGVTAESAFVNSIGVGEGGGTSAMYWRVFGSILFEDTL